MSSRRFVAQLRVGLLITFLLGAPNALCGRLNEAQPGRLGITTSPDSGSAPPNGFILNCGQFDPAVRFKLNADDHTAYFTHDEVVFAVNHIDSYLRRDSVIRMVFRNASQSSQLEGMSLLTGKLNYFIGGDRSRWVTAVPRFESIAYREIYPGIDAVYRFVDGSLKSEFTVGAGADPALIRMEYVGALSIEVTKGGELSIATESGMMVDSPPIAYQPIGNRKVRVHADYVVFDTHLVGFVLSAFDKRYPLIIDPSIDYSTYLGSGAADQAMSTVVDAAGNAYVAGATYGSDFPVKDSLQSTYGGGSIDGYVAKFGPNGDLLFSTYLGGLDDEYFHAVALDGSGNMYVAGKSASANFPVVNPVQASCAGDSDAVVVKLDPSGSSILFSTYLGGSSGDDASGLGVTSDGHVWIAGYTKTNDFPTSNAFQGTYGGGFTDAFVARVDTSTPVLVFSTFLGGSGDEHGEDIVGECTGQPHLVIDTSGNAYVTGRTNSPDFPTVSAYQSSLGGATDAFVAKLSPSGTLAWSTYLGGSGCDAGLGISTDSAGGVYVTGYTASEDFPTENPVQATNAGGFDAFVTKLCPSGTTLEYSTYLGGSSNEGNDGGVFRGIGAICIDTGGSAYLTGLTASSDFPTVDPAQGTSGGSTDAYIAKLSPSGSSLLFSSYLGGSNTDFGRRIAVDWLGDIYVCGFTQSSDFPTSSAFQPSFAGGYSDAFVAKLDGIPGPIAPSAPSCLTATGISSGRIDLQWTDNSENESGFEIERKPQGGAFSQIGSVAANTTSYSDSGLSGGTYCYRVRAYNNAGGSAFSNEHCSATTTASALEKMYITDFGAHEVVAANLDGSDRTGFGIAGCESHGPVSIAINPIAGKLYVSNWAEDKIIMADLDGGSAQTLSQLDGSIDGPNHIALDIATGKMYIANENTNSVTVADLDGSSPVVLNLGGTLNEPYGIALDVPAGRMYVQNYSGPIVNVVRANLDGSSPVVMDLDGKLSNSRDIALDLVARKMYVVNTGTNSVTRANLDGTCAEVLYLDGKLSLPYGIALDVPAGKMCVVNYGTGNVVAANLDGTDAQVLALMGGLSACSDIELGPQQAGDTSPPDPDPMEWDVKPNVVSANSIAMTAAGAADPSGVEYFFEETTGNPGGDDSGWQDSREYTDTGLSPKMQYCYRVKARDKSTNANETGWATAECSSTGILGDINGDGLVDLIDVLMLYRYLESVLELTPDESLRADIDQDGDVDEDDALVLVGIVFGSESGEN